MFSGKIYSSVSKKLVNFDTNNLPIPENTFLHHKLFSNSCMGYNTIKIENIQYQVFDYSSEILEKIRSYIANEYHKFITVGHQMIKCVCKKYHSQVCKCLVDFTYTLIRAFDFLLLLNPPNNIMEDYKSLIGKENALIYKNMWKYLVLTFDERIEYLFRNDYQTTYLTEYRTECMNNLGEYVYEVGQSAIDRIKYGSSNIVEVYLDKNDNLGFGTRIDILTELVFGKKPQELDIYINIRDNILNVYIGNTELSTYHRKLNVHLDKIDISMLYEILLNYPIDERLYVINENIYGTHNCNYIWETEHFIPEGKTNYTPSMDNIIYFINEYDITSIHISTYERNSLQYTIYLDTDTVPFRYTFDLCNLVSNKKEDFLDKEFCINWEINNEKSIDVNDEFIKNFINMFIDFIFD